MRYLILSDIHSNDEALAAVLSRVRRKRFDRVVVLGDFVGYGAEPEPGDRPDPPASARRRS